MVKRHLLEGAALSDHCDEAQITTSQVYQRQQQLFERAASAFEKPGKPAGPPPVERRVAPLEQRQATKNQVIAELTEENIRLKRSMACLERPLGRVALRIEIDATRRVRDRDWHIVPINLSASGG